MPEHSHVGAHQAPPQSLRLHASAATDDMRLNSHDQNENGLNGDLEDVSDAWDAVAGHPPQPPQPRSQAAIGVDPAAPDVILPHAASRLPAAPELPAVQGAAALSPSRAPEEAPLRLLAPPNDGDSAPLALPPAPVGVSDPYGAATAVAGLPSKSRCERSHKAWPECPAPDGVKALLVTGRLLIILYSLRSRQPRQPTFSLNFLHACSSAAPQQRTPYITVPLLTQTHPLLRTGVGRSGTHHTAYALQQKGFKTCHEALCDDGAVSWTYAVVDPNAFYPWEASRSRIRGHRFATVVHQVCMGSRKVGKTESVVVCAFCLTSIDGTGVLNAHAWEWPHL